MRFVSSLMCLLLILSWKTCLIYAAPQNDAVVVANEEAAPPEAWLAFRARFPFHMQTLAATAPDAEGRRTLVVSEPPLFATLAGIRAVDPIRLASGTKHTWTVGYDGWVRDVVFDVPPTTPDEFQELIEGLSRYLFGTDYKAFVLDLPVTADVFRMKYPLDIRVTIGEVEAWYQNQDFTPLDGNEFTSLTIAPDGVYASAEPGLVAWIVPKRGIEQKRSDARRFALDSDLIIGAIDRGNSVVILARERQVPVTVLPPLRWEMIRDLAAATGKPLAQSYERSLFAAGPTWKGWDWAPIYLSPELLDSEYGSILNCTDQMLKGWSLAGLVEYRNFPHPLPERLPFNGPLVTQLGAEELLFNWNTAGFGVTSHTAQGVLYATNRTGALPVTYRSDNQPHEQFDPEVALFEEHAYAYFASLNNPMLARVVQYTALYQIFRTGDVVAPAREWPVWSHSDGLEAVARRVLRRTRHINDKAIDDVAQKILSDNQRRLEAGELGVLNSREMTELLRGVRNGYCLFLLRHGPSGERALAKWLARTRERTPEMVDDQELQSDLLDWTAVFTYQPLTAVCDVEQLQEEFSKSRPASAGEAWIRTPTVVYSRTLGPIATGSGGHNLDPHTVRIIRDASQPSGRISLTPEGAVICNPSDAAIIECHPAIIARATNRAELIARLKALVNGNNSVPPPQSLTNALQIGTPSPGSIGRGLKPHHLSSSNPAGSRSPLREPSFTNSIGGSGEVLVVSVQEDQVVRIRRMRGDGTLSEGEFWSSRDASFAIRCQIEGAADNGQPLRIRFDDSCPDAFTDRTMRDVAKATSLRENSRNRADRFVVLLRTAPNSEAVLNQRVRGLDLNGLPDLQRLDDTAHRVTTKMNATVGVQKYPIEIDAYLVHAEGLNAGTLTRTLQESIQGAENLTLAEVPEHIMSDLMTTFQAAKGSSFLRANMPDLGDFTISRFEHRGRTVGTVVLARGTR